MLLSILVASILESLVSFLAGVAVIYNEKRMKSLVHGVISLAVGVMLGTVFFDILPETFELIEPKAALPWVLGGFLVFFVLEKILFWYHRHENEESIHASAYLVLWGDALHNFIDGVFIAFAFAAGFPTGVIASFAVILHEIPQEASDFTVMLHGGFTKQKALFWNTFVSITTVVGALVGYYVALSHEWIGFLLAVVAGNFLYIAAADLIPELHHKHDSRSSVAQVLLVFVGVFVIVFALTVIPE
ncbi:MAG: ZIP family metal transporter [Patescibacteria group bacterium]